MWFGLAISEFVSRGSQRCVVVALSLLVVDMSLTRMVLSSFSKFLCLSLFLNCNICCCQGFKVSAEGVHQAAEFIEQNIAALDVPLPAVSSRVISVDQLANDAAFVVVQAHVAWRNITLAHGDSSHPPPQLLDFPPSWLVSGAHVAQVVALRHGQRDARVTVANPWQDDVTVLVVVSVYTDAAPMPGGCSTEGPIPFQAYLNLQNGPPVNRFQVPRARIVKNRTIAPSCDSSISRLRYRTFVSLPIDSNLRANHVLFRSALLDAISPTSLQKLSTQIEPMSTSDIHFSTVTHECQTMIFSVLVFLPDVAVVNNEEEPMLLPSSLTSVYAPAVFYACPTLNVWGFAGCPLLGSLSQLLVALSLIVPAVWLLVPQPSGLFSTHSRLVLCCTLVLSAAFLSALMLVTTRLTVTSLLTAYTLSCLFALLYAQRVERHVRCLATEPRIDENDIWRIKVQLLPAFIVVVATLAAFVMFTTQVHSWVFADDLTFWMIFSLLVTTLTCIMLIADSQKVVGTLSSIMGTIWLSTALGLIIGALLPYILVDLFRRAVEPGFGDSYLVVSLQWTDAFVIMFAVVVFIISHCHYTAYIDQPHDDVSGSVQRLIRVLSCGGGGACDEQRQRQRLLVDANRSAYGSTNGVAPVSRAS